MEPYPDHDKAMALFRNLPQMLEGWKLSAPEYYRLITAKKYKNVDKFHDHRYARLSVASWLSGWETSPDEEFAQAVNSYAHDMIAAKLAADHNIPEFFVDSQLLEATVQTMPPESTDWRELRFPFPSLYFILPKGSVKANNIDVLCIGMTRIEEGQYLNPRRQKGRILQISPTSLRFIAICANGEEYSRTVVQNYRRDELGEIADDPWQFEIDYADEEFLRKMPAIALNLLMAMLARPEYLEAGVRRGRDKKSGSELWTPNILGKRYVVRGIPPQGSHASPRMHWRRGHFRLQRYGSGLTEQKVIWVEPTLVNAAVAADS